MDMIEIALLFFSQRFQDSDDWDYDYSDQQERAL